MNETHPQTPPSMARFFDWLRGLGIARTDEAWIAGVCGAVARRTGLDPLVIRGVAIVVALLGGPVFLAYAVGWALLPDSGGRIHLERVMRGIVDPAIIAIGILVVLTFVPSTQGIWWRGVPAAWGMPGWLQATLGTAWTLGLIGCAIWLVVVFARRGSTTDRASDDTSWAAPSPDAPTAPMGEASAPTEASTASRPWGQYQQDWRRQAEERERAQRARDAERRADRIARQPGAGYVAISLGLAVVAGGAAAFWAQQAGFRVAVIGIAAALVVLAVATIVAGVRGRESGGLGLFSTIAVVGLVVFGVLPAGTQVNPIGSSTHHVEQVAHGTSLDYATGVGSTTIDLRDLRSGEAGGHVNLWVGAGSTIVRMPSSLPVRVEVSGVGYGIGASNADDSTGGVLSTTTLENDAARSGSGGRTTDVHVWVIGGSVDVPNATITAGAGR
jgi:phage shock protein PspC (stress-responsive transcriptional regulator)